MTSSGFDEALLRALSKHAADRCDAERRRRYAAEQLEQLIEREGAEHAIHVCDRVYGEVKRRGAFWNRVILLIVAAAVALAFGPLQAGHIVGALGGFLLYEALVRSRNLWPSGQ